MRGWMWGIGCFLLATPGLVAADHSEPAEQRTQSAPAEVGEPVVASEPSPSANAARARISLRGLSLVVGLPPVGIGATAKTRR